MAVAVLGEEPVGRGLDVDESDAGVMGVQQTDALGPDVAAQVGRVPDEIVTTLQVLAGQVAGPIQHFPLWVRRQCTKVIPDRVEADGGPVGHIPFDPIVLAGCG